MAHKHEIWCWLEEEVHRHFQTQQKRWWWTKTTSSSHSTINPSSSASSMQVDGEINKGWLLFLSHVLSTFWLCFSCLFPFLGMLLLPFLPAIIVSSKQFSFHPITHPISNNHQDWLLCFIFLFDCCVFDCFSLNFTVIQCFLLPTT